MPRISADRFPGEGTQLERYARVLRGVEINSSAYRDHGAGTYANWARQTPRHFRFAVKIPQQITHELRLRASRKPLEQFLASIAGLRSRLGPLVVQLPPSLSFETRVARGFFRLLREYHVGPIACEPRHPDWFEPAADTLLQQFQIARIAADPAVVPAAALPGGWPGLVYCRLHGSPRKYWSIYDRPVVEGWSRLLLARPPRTPAWCVFDNTAASGAAGNALQMLDIIHARQP